MKKQGKNEALRSEAVDPLLSMLRERAGVQGFRLEELVLHLLEARAKHYGLRVLPQWRIPSGRAAFDGYIEGSIDDLPAPIAVEVVSRAPPFQQLHRYIRACQEEELASLLLVIGQELTEHDAATLRQEVDSIAANAAIRVHVWDLKRVSQEIAKFPEAAAATLPGLWKLGVSRVVERATAAAPDDWRREQEQLVNTLRQNYHEAGIFLFLGAGCSIDAGLPGWDALISNLLLELVDQKRSLGLIDAGTDSQKLASALEIIETSPLLLARIIREGLGSEFEPKIRKALYERTDDQHLVKSPLLRSLAKLCVPARGVHGVVTYNFDDLLELHLDEVGRPYTVIRNQLGTVAADSLPIFHVHGYMPRAEPPMPDSDDVLVFSEEGYHRLFNDPYFWANVVQLNYLRERTCLFVGLSLTDPSLRRLLDAVASQNRASRHFILMKRMLSDELVKAAEQTQLTLNENQAETLLRVYYELQQLSTQKIGLNIVWFEGYTELPTLIDKVREART